MANTEERREDLRKEVDELRADLKALRSDIGELTRAVGELAGEQVQGARESIKDEVGRAREALRRGAASAKARGQAAQEDIESEISDHPYASMAISFGLGFIIAKFMEMSSRS